MSPLSIPLIRLSPCLVIHIHNLRLPSSLPRIKPQIHFKAASFLKYFELSRSSMDKCQVHFFPPFLSHNIYFTPVTTVFRSGLVELVREPFSEVSCNINLKAEMWIQSNLYTEHEREKV